MGCSSECNDSHTYRQGCVAFRTARSAHSVGVGKVMEECVNVACINKIGEGDFGIVAIPNPRSGPPVVLLLCSPCIATLKTVTW